MAEYGRRGDSMRTDFPGQDSIAEGWDVGPVEDMSPEDREYLGFFINPQPVVHLSAASDGHTTEPPVIGSHDAAVERDTYYEAKKAQGLL
jgi:hypothetical protein